MQIISSLENYIYGTIVPRYAFFDDAHKEDHALTVIGQAMKLLDDRDSWILSGAPSAEVWNIPVDRNMLLAAAACHDLGLVNGRENHHLDSGRIIREDTALREWFDAQQVEVIAQAAEDHRASGKGAPRSIYGMIVAEADRVIDSHTIIRRTIQYGLKHYPELDTEGHISRASAHLAEKYGRGGYLRLWIPWSDNASRLEELQNIIDDPESLRKEVERMLSELI